MEYGPLLAGRLSARLVLVARDVHVPGAERPDCPRLGLVGMTPDAPRVVRQQVDRDRRLRRRRADAMDVVARRQQRVEVAGHEGSALAQRERAAALRLGVDLLVLRAPVQPDEPPG